MYPWMDELLRRWRSEGRRPPKAGQGARILVRPSHVRYSTSDLELVRPVPSGEVTPLNQLLRRSKGNLPTKEKLPPGSDSDRKD